MSLNKFSFIGALMVGILPQVTGYSAEIDVKSSGIFSYEQDLVSLMNQSGVRIAVDLENRRDLSRLFEEASQRAQAMDSSCKVEGLSEIQINIREQLWTIGYEAFVHCEDTPSPDIAFYYDYSQKFLGALKLSR